MSNSQILLHPAIAATIPPRPLFPFLRRPLIPNLDRPDADWLDVPGLDVGLIRNTRRFVHLPDRELLRHVALVGRSGSGRNTYLQYLLSQQMLRGGGFLYIDACLDVTGADQLQHLARLAGREDDFYIVNFANPARSHSYNLILHGDADEIANRLLLLWPKENPDAELRAVAHRLLRATVAALMRVRKTYTLKQLAHLINVPAAWEAMLGWMPAASAEHAALKAVAEADKGTFRLNEVRAILGPRLVAYSKGALAQVSDSNRPDISIREALANNKIIVVLLPTLSHPDRARRLGNLLLLELSAEIAHLLRGTTNRDAVAIPFLVPVEHMHQYAFPAMHQLFEQARAAKVALLPMIPAFAELAYADESVRDAIMGYTHHKLFFRPTSADMFNALPAYVTARRPDIHLSAAQLRELGVGEALLLSGERLFHLDLPYLRLPEDILPYQIKRGGPQ